MDELPYNLKSDIQVTRYAKIVQNSVLFNDENGNIDEQLCRSFFRMMTTRFYMTDDFIIESKEPSNEMFLILSGDVRIIDADDVLIDNLT